VRALSVVDQQAVMFNGVLMGPFNSLSDARRYVEKYKSYYRIKNGHPIFYILNRPRKAIKDWVDPQ
jgi:hypothetical protein